ncbi:hypothetical protein [Acinetobacter bereziniae]|uniref:hypothetical protein n=1 Tax=Acinetobacter bereziniae TaxID=106648 RepID=UPI003008DB74
MIPPAIVEWAMWARLDRYQSIELILLKGHLLVEILLNDRLSILALQKEIAIEDLSFYRKLVILEKSAYFAEDDRKMIIYLAKDLNKLRNKLAHEIFYDGLEMDTEQWSKEVLKYIQSTKVQKYTSRTRFTQAIAALGQALYEINDKQ